VSAVISLALDLHPPRYSAAWPWINRFLWVYETLFMLAMDSCNGSFQTWYAAPTAAHRSRNQGHITSVIDCRVERSHFWAPPKDSREHRAMAPKVSVPFPASAG
jgi:hypothetical protein